MSRDLKLAALTVAALLVAAAIPALASATGWSAPVTIDAKGVFLRGVSCPSESFCGAVDIEAFGATYDGSGWSEPVRVDEPVVKGGAIPQIRSIACASPEFCSVVDYAGRAIIYDGSSWGAPVPIDAGQQLYDVSCPSSSFCLAVSGSEAMLYNGSSWSSPALIDASGTLFSASCASSSFCAAVGENGDAVIYNGSSWGSPVDIDDTGGLLRTVSCTSASFCIAADSQGNAFTYNGSTWSAAKYVGIHGLQSVSCVSASFCAGVQGLGNGAVTYDGSSWSDPAFLGSSSLTRVSCASASFCVAVGNGGEAFTYSGAPVTSSPQSIDPPSISGTPQTGKLLTCSPGSWSGEPAPTFSYRWRGNGVDVSGAVNPTYTVRSADEGHTLTCVVIASNKAGKAEATSAGVGIPEACPRAGARCHPLKASRCHVPALTGRRLSKAREMLARNHCQLGKVKPAARRRHRRHRHLTVVRQHPKAGTTLPTGSKVSVVLG